MITIIGVGSFLGLWALFLWVEWLKPKLERRKERDNGRHLNISI